MDHQNDESDIAVELDLTEADYRGADEVLRKYGPGRANIESARVFLAKYHSRFGASKFRLITGLRQVENSRDQSLLDLCSGRISGEEFVRQLLRHLEQRLDIATLARFFQELQEKMDAYVEMLQLARDTWNSDNPEDDVDEFGRQMNRLSRRLNRKLFFYREEIEYLRAFIAEARVAKGEGVAVTGAHRAASFATIAIHVGLAVLNNWDTCHQVLWSPRGISSAERFCRLCDETVPLPWELSAMLERELAVVKAYLRSCKQSQSTSQQVAVQHVTVSVQADHAKVMLHQNDDATEDTDDSAERRPLLSVENWHALAIGIDVHWNYYAIPSAPVFGAKVCIRKATLLELPGKRWKTLLNLLARSPDGQTVSLVELIRTLDYLPPSSQLAKDSCARSEELSAATSAELTASAATALKQLRATLGDLRRKLRDLVDGPSGRGKACLQIIGDQEIKAGFRVAHLLSDESGHLRFGDPRSQ